MNSDYLEIIKHLTNMRCEIFAHTDEGFIVPDDWLIQFNDFENIFYLLKEIIQYVAQESFNFNDENLSMSVRKILRDLLHINKIGINPDFEELLFKHKLIPGRDY